MLINLNGDTVIETDLVIGFRKINECISMYMKELSGDCSCIGASFDSVESCDVAFQKLEKLLKVRSL